MKVLFCTDGSEVSYYALHKSINFIQSDTIIDVLTVLDWGFFPTYVSFPEEEDFYPAYDLAKSILGETEKIIQSYNHNVGAQEYLTGNPVKIILDKIKNNDGYDLVVLGSHGKKGIRNWLGSVSRKIVSQSPIPVLIARPSKDVDISPNLINKVLVTADGSSCSYNAIEEYSMLFKHVEQEVELITVSPGVESFPLEISMDNEWLEKCLDKQKELAEEIIEKSEKLLEDNGIKVEKSVIKEGDAAEQINLYGKQNAFDLVVLGSHGREGLSDFLLGSVSKRVLDHSYRPVLIIPIKNKL